MGRVPEPSLFKRIAYIYVGSSNYNADCIFYSDVLGARKVWEFEEFGARVVAFDLAGEPYLLVADHVKAPSKRLIYEVEDIDAAKRSLEAKGWKADGEGFEVPDGPCVKFEDKSGNEFAIIQMTRPRILERSRRP